MTAVQERSQLAIELYGHIPAQYRPTFETMLALVPNARAHFEVGNVETAIKLMNAHPTTVKTMDKGLMLTFVLQAMPITYQMDLDPEFDPNA